MKAEIGRKVTKMPGVDIRVTDACVGCGTCIEDNVCFVNALSLVDGKAVISEECRACGRCVEICPYEAIELLIDESKFIDDSIERVSSVVDVE